MHTLYDGYYSAWLITTLSVGVLLTNTWPIVCVSWYSSAMACVDAQQVISELYKFIMIFFFISGQNGKLFVLPASDGKDCLLWQKQKLAEIQSPMNACTMLERPWRRVSSGARRAVNECAVI